MADVLDLAEYVLSRLGAMTAMKLEKLCYYSQAWGLVWNERPLVPNSCEAWANGPVFPTLYRAHRGMFTVSPLTIKSAPESLSAEDQRTVDSVLDFYGGMSAVELSELTHREAPWRDARGNTPPGESSNEEIPLAAMAEYYESLVS